MPHMASIGELVGKGVGVSISCKREWNSRYRYCLKISTGQSCLLSGKLAKKSTAGNSSQTHQVFNEDPCTLNLKTTRQLDGDLCTLNSKTTCQLK